MKIWLDDERAIPDGFTYLVKTPEEAIALLKTNKVDTISLDHDLGMYIFNPEPTGNTVLVWIEEQVFTNPNFKCPEILIHTANPSAKRKMLQGVRRIEKLINKV